MEFRGDAASGSGHMACRVDQLLGEGTGGVCYPHSCHRCHGGIEVPPLMAAISHVQSRGRLEDSVVETSAVGIKACNKCRYFKSFSEFISHDTTFDRLSTACNECRSSGARQRYQNTQEQARRNRSAVESLPLKANDIKKDIALFQAFLSPDVNSLESVAAHLEDTPRRIRWRLSRIYSDLGVLNLIQALRIYRTALRADELASQQDTIRSPLASGSPNPLCSLTEREVEILKLVADGDTNDQIGAALSITSRSASFHVSNIMEKLSVSKRYRAALIFDDEIAAFEASETRER